MYLPTELKSAVTEAARRRGVSEAEVIRSALVAAVGQERPRPRAGLIAGAEPVARRVDELLEGFGDR